MNSPVKDTLIFITFFYQFIVSYRLKLAIVCARHFLETSSFLLQLTDFGLSKIGLINSTDDFSGPSINGTVPLGDNGPISQSLSKREHRQKHSVVGTPDYLAPEILLGMGHGL